MKKWLIYTSIVATTLACSSKIPQQINVDGSVKSARPLPNPIEYPREYQMALAAGTRTVSGNPGANYWINKASYDIQVKLFTAEKRAEASQTVVYTNNSPDTLRRIGVNLNLNLHKEGAVRNEPSEVTGGMEIRELTFNGAVLSDTLRKGPHYRTNGTYMLITGDKVIAPGESVTLGFKWDFNIPKEGASGRMGWDKDNLYHLAYFYPQIAVYDDVIGWHLDQFQGTAEFYADFADYNVTVETTGNWYVLGTGDLTNAKDVLADKIYDRMILGHKSDSVVHVITKEDFNSATKGDETNFLKWNFKSTKVRDVAFTIARESMWDATRAKIGDLNGDKKPDFVAINSVWRESAFRWAKAWDYGRNSIEFLSEFTGLKYPWPHMTVVEAEGIVGGGMEYPMITIIGSYNRSSDKGLYGTTAHEIAHMWVPMMVNNNERRYAWMDEGTTSFNENQASKAYFDDPKTEMGDKQGYLYAAKIGIEGEIMRWSDYHYNSFAYGTATYSKASTNLASLRGVLGDEVFTKAYKTYLATWQFKHPYPWDMWAVFESVSGRDLDWFWTTWYYETWTLDQAIESVKENESGATIVTIADFGNAPMPTPLLIIFADGTHFEHTISEQVWLKGVRKTTFEIPSKKKVKMVQIDAKGLFPDADLTNNLWSK